MEASLIMAIVGTARQLIEAAIQSAERARQDGSITDEQLEEIRTRATVTDETYQRLVEQAREEVGLPPRG